jgi:hypothetical protein
MTISNSNLRLANPAKLQRFSWMLDRARSTLADELLRRNAAKPEELRNDGEAGLRRVLQARRDAP